jgi:hypothetical protein
MHEIKNETLGSGLTSTNNAAKLSHKNSHK